MIREWRRWANISISTRQGVGLLEMDAAQTAAAFGLMAATLSARGFETSRNIMRLEGHLADLMNDYNEYGERRYWFTVMGEPSESQPWGWQLDGHHLIVNCFVLGDQVVLTPTFMGSEPPRAAMGRFAGTAILEEELAVGLALINALDDEQRAVAIIDPDKTANDNHGELFQDNAVVPYEGIRLGELDDAQRELALKLISLYTGNLRAGHAEVRLSEVVRHWDDTYFAWVGDTGPDAVFYYRIHSPVILIEYDHQTPVALDGPDRPSRNHVHTVVRTPNGNDYGKDLLRQHLLEHPHTGGGLAMQAGRVDVRRQRLALLVYTADHPVELGVDDEYTHRGNDGREIPDRVDERGDIHTLDPITASARTTSMDGACRQGN